MSPRAKISAGLLMFKRVPELQVLIAHPGGPIWAGREEGAWTIPKGVAEPNENFLDAAKREFGEELGVPAPRNVSYLALGSVTQRSGKVVHAWAVEGDVDPAITSSNSCQLEWPRRSGSWITIPEIDRCAWVDVDTARVLLNPAQADFVTRLLERV